MKRPLGWIGLCFLSVLAVIFWFGEALIMPVLICSAVMFVCGMLFILVKRFEKLRAYLAVIGATAFVASSFIFLYQRRAQKLENTRKHLLGIRYLGI